MNCRRVEKLMPLYIEGDLRFELANRVKLHVDSCRQCCALASGYKDSQSWLRSTGAPEFDDAIFNDLKRGVLNQIEETEARATVFASFAQQWTRRQMLAVAAAFLVVFAAVAFYFYQARMNVSSAISGNITSEPNEKTETPKVRQLTAGTEKAPGASSKPRRHHAQAASLRSVTSRHEQQFATERMNSSLRGADSRTDGEADQRPMLRIEFQTSDPNIRIIWFAPSQADSHQTKPATD
jgi:Putative zinc-finger